MFANPKPAAALTACAVLTSPTSLAPLIDLDLEVEFCCERDGTSYRAPVRLTVSQLQGKSALVTVAPPRHPRRMGAWTATWTIGNFLGGLAGYYQKSRVLKFIGIAAMALHPMPYYVVALLPETGMRYLSKVYNEEWMRERGYVESSVPITAAEVVSAKKQSGKVRDLVIVRPYQTVFHALKTMQEQDISQIPVFEENVPIGTVYEDQILTLALQGKDLRKLVVREVMSRPLPSIPKNAKVERVTYILSHENPAVFVDMGEGKFEILTKYDLMSTVARLMEQKR